MIGVLPFMHAVESAPPVTLDHTEARHLTSKIAGRTYQLSVLLPARYDSSDQRYPVLYVLDGGWNFSFLHGLSDTLSYAERLPEMIIVGIDYGLPYTELMKARAHDFTPTAWKPNAGGAGVYLHFLENELIPFIDATYRTDPRDRGLLGHSYGGLFGIYAWLERPTLFQHIVAASPSIYWDDEVLIKEAAKRLPVDDFPARLDVSIGSAEDAGNVASVEHLEQVIKAHPPIGGAVQFTIFPGENHNSAKPLSFIKGLQWAYAKK
jgi:uncharacterized protein